MRIASQLIVMVGLAGTLSLPAAAQTETGPPTKPLFTWRDAALLGGATIATAVLAPVDVAIANRLRDSTVQENRFIGTLAAAVRDLATPYSVFIGVSLYAYGRLAKDKRAAELGLHGTEALVIGQVAGVMFKGLFGRERPYVKRDPYNYGFGRGFAGRGKEHYRSFPSGHTISAFAAAAAVTSETRRWWRGSEKFIGPAMYGGATLAGISRIYHNRHWASDIMMGAAIGTMAGIKVVRYHHTHPENAIDRWLLSGSASRDASGKVLVRWSVMPMLGH
ncbi:MAG: phosphatase PAP2 family protein [Gemmatimonadota bacterium]|nr:phosphatase PAP2 family protein [Gemmatimonadota bacterium]